MTGGRNKIDDAKTEAGAESAATGLPVLPAPRALLEIVFLFALIYGLDRLTPNLALLDISPHPFWIPVLLVSLQYGTVSGFIAAAVAIGLSLFAGLPEQDIGENLFAYFLRVWGQPILWIGVALLVGQFRMRQLAAKQELRIANQKLMQQRDDLARHAGELRSRIELLEQELVTRFSAGPHAGATVLWQAMAGGGLGYDTTDRGTATEALKCVSDVVFPGSVIVYYLLKDGRLAEAAVYGRAPDTGRVIHIDSDHALFRTVVSLRKIASILDRRFEAMLSGVGLAALPVLDGEGGDVCGMLVVERAEPDLISNDGLLALQMAAHTLAPRMDAAGDDAARDRTLLTPRRIRNGIRQPVVKRAAKPADAPDAKPQAKTEPADRRQSLMQLLARAGRDVLRSGGRGGVKPSEKDQGSRPAPPTAGASSDT